MRFILALCAALVICQAHPHGDPDDYEIYDDEVPDLTNSDLETYELPWDDYVDLSDDATRTPTGTKDNDKNDDDDDDDDTTDEEPEVALFHNELTAIFKKANRTDPNFMVKVYKQILESFKKMVQDKPEYADALKKVNEYLANPEQKDLFVFIKDIMSMSTEKDYEAEELMKFLMRFAEGKDTDEDGEAKSDDDAEDADDEAEADDNYDASRDEDDEDEEEDVNEDEDEDADGDDDEDADDDDDDGDDDGDNATTIQVSQTYTDTLDYLADPDIPKAVEATEEVNKVENETIITSQDGGFELMKMTSRFQQTKGLRKKHLLKSIKREFELVAKNQEKLKGIMENILDHVENGKTNQTDGLFAMISEAELRMTRAVFFYYKVRDDGKYNMKKLRLEGTMRLAASLVITRITESNSTHSESKDIISYVPREDADEIDVMKLLKTMVPDLGKILKKISFDDVAKSTGRKSMFA